MSDKNPSFYIRGCRLAGVQVRSINRDHMLYICMDTDLGLIDHIFRFKDLKELKEACRRISDVCLSLTDGGCQSWPVPRTTSRNLQ